MQAAAEVAGRVPRRVALGVAAAVGAVVGGRIVRDGPAPYGSDGAEYIEHAARLAVRDHVLSGEVLNPWRLLTTSDGSFPPLLHLTTVPAGTSAAAAALTSIGWMLLLAASVGIVAAHVARRRGAAAVSVGAAAAAGTLLVPAVSGMATRYYYDLPMIALLWAATAVLLTGVDRRPLAAGLGAGGLLLAACLTKWAALPFGPPMLVGALLVGARGDATAPGDGAGAMRAWWGRRATAAAVCAGVAAAGCRAFLAGRAGDNSFAKMGRVAFAEGSPVEWEGGGGGAAAAPGAIEAALGGIAARVTGLELVDLAYYPVALGTSIFGVAGALVVLALGVAWARRGAPGGLLVAAVAAGHGAFLLGVMPVLDDRFAAVGAPALVVAAALGWGTLGEVARRRAGIAAVAVGAAVSVDFHVGLAAPWNAELPILVVDRDDFPPTNARGLGCSSSVEQRGWSRRDAEAPRRMPLRAALWDAIDACAATGLGVVSERALIADGGDGEWMRYESWRGGGRPTVGNVCGPDGRWEHEVALDLVAVADGDGLPGCLVADGGWRRAVEVGDPDGGRGVTLWARDGACVQ